MMTIIMLIILLIAFVAFIVALFKADSAMMCMYCDRKRERKLCMKCIENKFDKFMKE